MGELCPQSDGYYALCFRNVKGIGDEETREIFQTYGNVQSIRKSSDSIPWVFIRYRMKEEALKALDELRGYKDFDIQVAKSNSKKKPDPDGDQLKADCASEYSKDNRSSKGSQYKNRGSERFVMDNEDSDSYDIKGGFKKGQYNRRQNNSGERPQRNREGDNFYNSDRGNDTEGARALSPCKDMNPKNLRVPNGRNSGGREHRASEREYEENTRRSSDGSPPRLEKKSPRNRGVPGATEIGDGPPKLVKGSDYYRLNMEESTTRSLALRAAHDEVWKNHPLQSQMKLKEVIMTNFDQVPSRKDIYELCLPVKPLHVSFGETSSKSVYCRVLVATEAEVQKLLMLCGEELYVTTLEDLLDEFFINDN